MKVTRSLCAGSSVSGLIAQSDPGPDIPAQAEVSVVATPSVLRMKRSNRRPCETVAPLPPFDLALGCAAPLVPLGKQPRGEFDVVLCL